MAHTDVAGSQLSMWTGLFSLRFPHSTGAMALAIAGSPDFTERITDASACELKPVGINRAYSAAAGVNSDTGNPVIGLFIPRCHCDDLSCPCVMCVTLRRRDLCGTRSELTLR